MENNFSDVREVLIFLAEQNPAIIKGFQMLANFQRNDLAAMAVLNMLYKHDMNLLPALNTYKNDMEMAGEPVLGLKDFLQHEIAQYLQTLGE